MFFTTSFKCYFFIIFYCFFVFIFFIFSPSRSLGLTVSLSLSVALSFSTQQSYPPPATSHHNSNEHHNDQRPMPIKSMTTPAKLMIHESRPTNLDPQNQITLLDHNHWTIRPWPTTDDHCRTTTIVGPQPSKERRNTKEERSESCWEYIYIYILTIQIQWDVIDNSPL